MESDQIMALFNMVAAIGVNLFLMVAFAGIVEGITEFAFAPWFEVNAYLASHKYLLPLVPIPLGIIGALLYQFDLLHELSAAAGGSIAITLFGMICTGILIARGSNWVHQYTERFYPAKRG